MATVYMSLQTAIGRPLPAFRGRSDEDRRVAQEALRRKLDALIAITDSLNISMKNVACMGDDLPDLPLLAAAGLAIAVNDADPELLAIADWRTELGGGQGCVREVCDRMVRAKR